MATLPTAEPPLFEAVITPHQSLSPRGLRVVLGLLLALSGSISTGLWLAGAWPVVAVNGVELTLAALLLRHHLRARQRTETLLLTSSGLSIRHAGAGGRQAVRRLSAAWLRVELEERPGRAPLLLLADRRRRVEVGADLGEAERRQLAAALQAALHQQRHPVFDNPQTRPASRPH